MKRVGGVLFRASKLTGGLWWKNWCLDSFAGVWEHTYWAKASTVDSEVTITVRAKNEKEAHRVLNQVLLGKWKEVG